VAGRRSPGRSPSLHLMAIVAEGIAGALFQEDGLDTRLEKLLIERLRRRRSHLPDLPGGRPQRLRWRETSNRTRGDCRDYKTGNNFPRTDRRNHADLQKSVHFEHREPERI